MGMAGRICRRCGVVRFRRWREAAVRRRRWALGMLLVPGKLLTRRTRLPKRSLLLLRRQTVPLVVRVHGLLWLHRRVLQFGRAIGGRSPAAARCEWRRGWTRGRRVLSVRTPLRAGRTTTQSAGLIGLRVDVLRVRHARLAREAIRRLTFQECEARFDVDIGGIKVGGASVCVKCIARLVVARLVLCHGQHKSYHIHWLPADERTHQGPQVVPHLRDVWVQADGAGVGIQRIPVLIDLVVEHADRAPERWIPAVAVDGLLICLVCLGILLL